MGTAPLEDAVRLGVGCGVLAQELADVFPSPSREATVPDDGAVPVARAHRFHAFVVSVVSELTNVANASLTCSTVHLLFGIVPPRRGRPECAARSYHPGDGAPRHTPSSDGLLDGEAGSLMAPRLLPSELLDRPDDWPDGTTTDPHADRAQRLALNLTAAMGTMTVRQPSEASGVSVGTVNLTRGQTWPDALAVMRVEQTLSDAI